MFFAVKSHRRVLCVVAVIFSFILQAAAPFPLEPWTRAGHDAGIMFGYFRKRRAIKSFVRDMGPALRKDFGTKPHYTPEEVQHAARQTGIGQNFIQYAFCMYCTHAAFDAFHSGGSSHSDYDTLRQEVGNAQYGGNANFDASTPLEADSSHSDSGSSGSWGDSGGGWDSGGGDSGGDGGGGGE